ncbi:aromatic ring-hydroxylating dioxygenase subunit alpha [Chroococcidiopsis sp. TS-821]|uniref:aromatic ring-hydroxylating dioxygenase subunit alpha n=1 Tax=Chroococcidiopsis sp. TS-821 TaxID=1378066 RepID=UPI000CEF4F14|nr:aromatic ring-hydroxylating dioxygenase subunit alpha [Chroococcidiopsis sp. TS-821]PPS43563.1 Rieske (2Fe-2S) protein [Chroococcidiopsis sp. TS-821]
MLVTQQPVLKRFWYPVMPMAQLSSQPQSFVLLGQAIALWLDEKGQPAAVADRCCHRSAQLSKGDIIDGCVRCPYHGWFFDRQGTCVAVPQLKPEQSIPASYRVPSYKCAERYGYVWVCLHDDPLLPIPYIPEAEDPAMRLIPQFYEPWQCSGLRLMENSFDNAHFSFVHAESFGNQQQPEPASSEISSLEYGLQVQATIPVVNPPTQRKNLNIEDEVTVRYVVSTWYMPFSRTLKITYPNGLMHLIFTAATPVSDRISQVVQFCIRNDTEADAKAADIVAFDRQVTQEDKLVLETTDYDTPLDINAEQHMPSDQPGIIMRRKLAALLKAHGEVEQRLEMLVSSRSI